MAGALVGRGGARGAARTAGGLAKLVIRQITEGPSQQPKAERRNTTH